MTFLPVVQRELRVAARRRGLFWSRLSAAAVAIFIGGGTLWFGEDWQSSASLGRSLFSTLTVLSFVFASVVGPIFTADVVSEEKREGTLGLLFLTDLHGYDVVVGKLVAASLSSVTGLLAILPVLALPLLLGGVSLAQFAQVALALANALFFSLTAGLAVSVVCLQARSAFALTGFVILVFMGFLPLGGSILVEDPNLAWLGTVLLGLSPIGPVRALYLASTRGTNLDFWTMLPCSHLLVWVFVGWSDWWVQRVWRQRPASKTIAQWRQRWQEWMFGTPEVRRQFRRRLLDSSPVLWLASRSRLKQSLLWGAMGVALTVWLVVALFVTRDWRSWSISFMVALFLQTPLKWLMASEATQRWTDDRQSGALELLLTTPLTVRELLSGQMRALGRLFGPPVLALIMVEALVLLLGLDSSSVEADSGKMGLVTLGLFVWDLFTLAWVGAWLGLVKRRPNRAFLGAMFRVLVVPWLLFVVLLVLLGPDSGTFVAGIWVVVCGTTNLALLLSARSSLHRHFRLVAAGQL